MELTTCYCPNQECPRYGQRGWGTHLVRRGYDHGIPRLLCRSCGQTFSARHGSAYLGIHGDGQVYTVAMRALAEGNSLRGTGRIVGVDKDTVSDWLDRAGTHCRAVSAYLFENLHMTECQLDELWRFVRKKDAHLTTTERVLALYGDAWVWVAFAPVWRVVLAFVVGKREQSNANLLIARVNAVSCGWIPFFTSDQLPHYAQALLHHYGLPEIIIQIPGKRGRKPTPHRLPPPTFLDAQVVKRRQGHRLVGRAVPKSRGGAGEGGKRTIGYTPEQPRHRRDPMDEQKYTSLVELFKALTDPRQARGKRHAWWVILAVIAAALASGQKNGRAIGQWVPEHREDLVQRLNPPGGRMPSATTLRRTLRVIDLESVETAIARYSQSLAAEDHHSGRVQTASGQVLEGQAIDGNVVRGATARGQPLHLVSRTRHGSGAVLGQVAVALKRNEITAVPPLLAGCDLTGVVLTTDALLTQRTIAQQILDQGGHSLTVVKENHPTMVAAIALLFNTPPWQSQTEAPLIQRGQTVSKGHGRIETRTVERSAALNDCLDRPGVAQVVRRTTQRRVLKTGTISEEVTFAVTSLPATEVGPTEVEALWRGHWTIENRLHYPRDVTLGEESAAIHVGHAPQALAIVRNILLCLFRHHGWLTIADATRHYAASVPHALALIGLP